MLPVMLKLFELYECTSPFDGRAALGEREGCQPRFIIINDGIVPSDLGVSLPQPRFKLIISFR
jgi:hypothetical protein